jgi:MATE family multidrug resistance protein
MSLLRAEIRKLASLALPVAATQVSGMLMGIVDTAMIGRVSIEALAAAALANVWTWNTLLFANGVIFGLDPIVAHAHGARDGERAAVALQRGVVLAVLLSVPVGLLWLRTDFFLTRVGQDPELARAAHAYVLSMIPGIPGFLVFSALRQYLQCREIVRPALWIILIANALNAFLNWVLIFGNLGAPPLGLIGAGIATSFARIASLVGLVVFVRAFALHEGAWVPWSRRAFEPRGLRELLSMGLPVAVQMSTEMWAFGAATLLAGKLGAQSLAAHTIAMSFAGLAFMVPLGISLGAVTRVGNLLGAGLPERSQYAAWVSLGMGAGVMTVSAFLFVTFRGTLPRLFTPDASLVALCATILPIAAAFQIFDGTQVVGCGILRGMGRTRPAAVFNVIGYWALALPLGGWLALRTAWGLQGLWWGLCLGLAVVAALLVLAVRFRGPATVRARAPLRAAPEGASPSMAVDRADQASDVGG